MRAAGSPFGAGRWGMITVPPCAWQRSAQSDIVTSRVAPQPEHQLALARLDVHARAQRFVLEAAGHVDQDLPAGEPALAVAVDVGVGD
jgi:hypothetical protein